ncbi:MULTISPECIES: hypothetical protein [unclassified Duganella]|uniref:hypothetical protein n=1 Tax=unclassified Duganella TaxID=2636909 RepID=UPI000E34272E|nr:MULTISPECIES: hypothetical protein [unclassified Duganella]RFP11229.1 hypothetical protein D0T23_20105 [Duganella sp. BJB475]RFP29548.1 hypothetical protein D0T21_16860 [Duganella sp. BJB476]
MGNRYGLRAVIVMALLALGCRVGLAQIGPRYVIELESAAAPLPPTAAGRVQLAGKGLALIHFQGLSILTAGADADAYSAEAVRQWPAADLLLVTPAGSGRYGGVAPLATLGKLPVIVAAPESAAPVSASTQLPADAPQFYPMQTWDTLHLRKGKTRLRVTALPGQPGTANVAGFMLEVGNSWVSYRLYVSCEHLAEDEAGALAQRLPGADLALLPDHHAPLLLALQRAARPTAVAAKPAVLTEAGHAFKALKR